MAHDWRDLSGFHTTCPNTRCGLPIGLQQCADCGCLRLLCGTEIRVIGPPPPETPRAALATMMLSAYVVQLATELAELPQGQREEVADQPARPEAEPEERSAQER